MILSLTTFIVNFAIKFIPIDKKIDKYLEKKQMEKSINKIENIELEMGEIGI